MDLPEPCVASERFLNTTVASETIRASCSETNRMALPLGKLMGVGTAAAVPFSDTGSLAYLTARAAAQRRSGAGTALSLPSEETLRGHSDSSFRGEGYVQCCVGVRLCDMYSNQTDLRGRRTQTSWKTPYLMF
ncbi:hypothetical protein ANN_04627 [Periplaneta americana]|uniref:Uncharacterized protein n=1 Tax=Periplaneta americana TaxID=6978 RepID=A0ABQ8T8Y3_PERAM|nr:hypothetical protein ANN_04627 [Periplaneta americana]